MKFSIKRKRNKGTYEVRSMKYEVTKKLWPAILLLSAIAVLTPGINAQEPENLNDEFTARKAFEAIHCSALEILPTSIRLDMLDYWDVDSVYKASNAMNGLSWLEAVNPTYLKVRISSASTLEFKILKTKKEDILMTVYTVGDDTQAMDSQVSFYDRELKELEAKKYFELPKVNDFFEIPKGSATKMKEIEEMIPFPTIYVTAFPDNNNLEARLTVEQYINQDDWNIAKLFVKPFITLEWKKDKYKLVK